MQLVIGAGPRRAGRELVDVDHDDAAIDVAEAAAQLADEAFDPPDAGLAGDDDEGADVEARTGGTVGR